jgi:translation initiation factor IF-2
VSQQPKVFEFAKEIGMSPLALMDKIREWKLPVRSHMAELDPALLEEIKTKLKGGDEPEPAKKKKVVKKASADSATSGAASEKPVASAAKKAAPKAAPKPANAPAKVVAKAAAAASASKAAEESAARKPGAVVVKKAVAKVVVRRKTEEETQAEEAAAEAARAAAAEPAEVASSDDSSSAAAAVVHSAPGASNAATASAAPAAAPSHAEASIAERTRAQAPAAESVAAPVSEISVRAEEPVEASVEKSTAGAGLAPAAEAAPPSGAGPGAGPGAPVPSRKREVVMTSGGPVSGVKSEPRRNIVGRMDLSRVQPPPGQSRPGGPGGPSRPNIGGPGGSRPSFGGSAGPRPLRTGFVASATPPPLEDEATIEARRRFDERRNKLKTPTASPTAPGSSTKERELEEELQKFSSTEFRKREMVFQPKKKKGLLNREAKRTQITQPKASKRIVKVNQTMKLSDLADAMGLKAGQLTKSLMTNGVMATMNTELDFDTIALIVPEFGFEAQNVHLTVEQLIEATSFGELTADSILRPPVVTIMGHVDHGKTSLLDVIRKANVAAGEAGGITQHIGAYQVKTESGQLITFIDTPGHEAFTSMRARGADVTDIVVVVVAADDGVMPQTIEAVSHAKAAGVPIIVAVNKMDKQGANPDRVKQQLTEQQLVPEEWGGDTIYVPVSAHTKQGVPELLEQIALVAEVADLKANPQRSATGSVIESRMDKGRGAVATLLVQDGTLKVGQSIVVGAVAGRVRSLINDRGERVEEAGPSVPVEVLGLPSVPLAGDQFDAVEDDQAAERIAGQRRDAMLALSSKSNKTSLEDIFSKLKQGDVKELAIVLKTDVAGSVEAIKGMFEKIGNAEVKLKIVHAAVGGINESDVLLAGTAKGIVVGFNVRPDSGAQATAKRQNVEIKTYTIVYELVDDMKKALGGLLQPDIVEKQLGRAEVRNMFTVPKVGTIAGSFVTEGKILRNAEVRLIRDGKIVYTGKISSLKRFKDDAREVAQGYECGIAVENFNDVKVGDIVEAFVKESVVREL